MENLHSTQQSPAIQCRDAATSPFRTVCSSLPFLPNVWIFPPECYYYRIPSKRHRNQVSLPCDSSTRFLRTCDKFSRNLWTNIQGRKSQEGRCLRQRRRHSGASPDCQDLHLLGEQPANHDMTDATSNVIPAATWQDPRQEDPLCSRLLPLARAGLLQGSTGPT